MARRADLESDENNESSFFISTPMNVTSKSVNFVKDAMASEDRWPEEEWQEILKLIGRMRDDLDDHYTRMREDFDSLEYRLGGESRYLGEQKSSRNRLMEFISKPMITRHILLICFIWQVINLVVVEFLYSNNDCADPACSNLRDLTIAIGVMAGFQVIMVFFIILISFKLVQDVLTRSLSMWFIIQSYLGTIMMFAGIYVLLHRIAAESFAGLPADDSTKTRAFLYYVDFLSFSIGVMSAGISKVYPLQWHAEILVSLQMLIAMMYWCVILGSGLDHVLTLTPTKPEKKTATLTVNTGSDAPLSPSSSTASLTTASNTPRSTQFMRSRSRSNLMNLARARSSSQSFANDS